MKFTIIGYGFVGKAVATTLANKHHIEIIDPALGYNDVQNKYDVDGIVICLPAPTKMWGTVNHTIITEYLDTIPNNVPVLIKSTITPTFAEENVKGNISYSPEFLTARNAIDDFANTQSMILSGDGAEFWHDAFKQVLDLKEVLFLSPAEASVTKYAINAFLATKVSYMNEIYNLCQQLECDYDSVAAAMRMDSRMGTSHFDVPGPDGLRGWGGACFPKDTMALSKMGKFEVLEAAIKTNRSWRK
jgi:nucleotide sugar dehydrogenase